MKQHRIDWLARLFAVVSVAVMCVCSVTAQRRITPVQTPDPTLRKTTTEPEKTADTPLTDENGNPLAPRPASVVEQRDMEGRVVLVDTISGREYRDTILVVAPKLVYPRFQAVTVGLNVWDLAARAFGQSHGLASIWAELSLHNWIKPFVEVGVGSADYTPKDESYHYKSSLAPFFKLGVNYNFLYNSDPRYSVYVGLRYGLTNFSYKVSNVTLESGYWDESLTLNVPAQRLTAGYAEALFGLRVQILSNISLGWEVKWHQILHESSLKNGKPWYIPGYGTRSVGFGASFSVSYTIPLSKTSAPAVPDPQ